MDAAEAPVNAPRVLLVDDGDGNRQIVTSILRRAGYEVDAVENGVIAVEAARDRVYDLILMDLMMPEMDGYEATAVIRSLAGAGKRTPIIAMTSTPIDELGAAFFAASFDGYLAKPVARKEMLALVDRWMGLADREIAEDAERPWAEAEILDASSLAQIREDVGEQDMFGVVSAFVREIRAQLAEMPDAVDGTGIAQMERQAHRLKANAGTLGATRLEALARRLEAAARRRDVKRAARLLEELRIEAESALRALDDVLSDLAPDQTDSSDHD